MRERIFKKRGRDKITIEEGLGAWYTVSCINSINKVELFCLYMKHVGCCSLRGDCDQNFVMFFLHSFCVFSVVLSEIPIGEKKLRSHHKK